MKVVLTNGCFDIIHAGHISMLWQAKALGDWLIVAVNSDESVRALKGPTRPVNSYKDRVAVLAAMKMVDLVVPLRENDMVEMLLSMAPSVWCKGGDYTLKTLNQAEVKAAKEVGTEIHIIPIVHAISTTKIIERLHST